MEHLITSLRALFPPQDIVVGEEALFFAQDESRATQPNPLAVVMPRNHQQVIDTVLWANTYGVVIVPSGGRTGLSGGACATNGEVVLSLQKMNSIIEFDEVQGLIHVEAGVILEQLQQSVAEKGWFYPVDYASRGSAQIGGAVATNAGGIRVLRYGMTRQWVAGLQAVTGSGKTLTIQRCLIKDNAGLDLKQLLIGSEGTLAIITEVTLQLMRPMLEQTTVLVGVDSIQQALQLTATLQQHLQLSALEFFCENALASVQRVYGLSAPFPHFYHYYLLVEWDVTAVDDEQVWQCLQGYEAIVATSTAQAKQLWAYREYISSSLNKLKPYKNDIACRLKYLTEWMFELEAQLKTVSENLQLVWFGHLGDGNLHINVVKPITMLEEDFASLTRALDGVVAQLTQRYNGTVSAEHGVGLLKTHLLESCRTVEEIEYYRAIKQVFDPNHILNRGKLLLLT